MRVLVIITAMTFHDDGNDLAEAARSGTLAGDDDNDDETEWDRQSNTLNRRSLRMHSRLYFAPATVDAEHLRNEIAEEFWSLLTNFEANCEAIDATRRHTMTTMVTTVRLEMSHNALVCAACYKFILHDDARYITIPDALSLADIRRRET